MRNNSNIGHIVFGDFVYYARDPEREPLLVTNESERFAMPDTAPRMVVCESVTGKKYLYHVDSLELLDPSEVSDELKDVALFINIAKDLAEIDDPEEDDDGDEDDDCTELFGLDSTLDKQTQEEAEEARRKMIEDFVSEGVRRKLEKDREYLDKITTFRSVSRPETLTAPYGEDTESYPDDNPKSRLGVKKPSLTQVPPVAIYQMGLAMADGKAKYGLMNWRDKGVAASVYLDAAYRHIMSWWDGEEVAEDSGVSHLSHAMACMAIILDASANGMLTDDRPTSGQLPGFLAAHTRK